MKLNCISTGSSGNCYLLENNQEVLILDCGVASMDIKKALDFDLGGIVGVVVTHSHT